MTHEHPHHTPDAAIDRAIDDVARRLSAGEPSADLHARIVRRIEPRREGRGRVSRTWRLLPVFVAAAAVTIFAVVSMKRASVAAPAAPGAPMALDSRSHDNAPTGSSPSSDAAASPAIASETTMRRVHTQHVSDSLSDDEIGWRERAVPALPRPAALELESIQPEPLAVPLLELKPLASAPIGGAGSDKAGQ